MLRVVFLATHIVGHAKFCVKPLALSAKIVIEAHWNTLRESSVWWQSFETCNEFQVAASVVSESKFAATQSALCLPGDQFAHGEKLKGSNVKTSSWSSSKLCSTSSVDEKNNCVFKDALSAREQRQGDDGAIKLY